MPLSLRDRLAFWLEDQIAPGGRLAAVLYAYEGHNWLGRACYRNRINGHVVVA